MVARVAEKGKPGGPESPGDSESVSPAEKKKQRRNAGRSASVNVQRGPVLITHWGLSGPAVIQASSEGARELKDAGYRAECIVDWIPALARQEKLDVLLSARSRLAPKAVRTVCPFRDDLALPLRLWRSLVSSTGCPSSTKWADISIAHVSRIADELQRSSFRIIGKGEFKEEFVTAGGVKADRKLSTKTMESRVTPGLFFAGEAVNIDGKTGGYNFQSCWSAGYVAGQAIALKHLQKTETTPDTIPLAVTQHLACD
jgi:predicted Rossmann fold flavoprotein